MAAIFKPMVLDWFQAHKEEPLIQFLTWYLILVAHWRLEDIYSIEIGRWRKGEWGNQRRVSILFVKNNGEGETWIVVDNDGKFYVESSAAIAGYTHVPNAATVAEDEIRKLPEP